GRRPTGLPAPPRWVRETFRLVDPVVQRVNRFARIEASPIHLPLYGRAVRSCPRLAVRVVVLVSTGTRRTSVRASRRTASIVARLARTRGRVASPSLSNPRGRQLS